MSATSKTHLIKIGNSQGIRIPKLLIEQIGLSNEVEIEAQTDHLIIRVVKKSREGWAESMKEMTARGDDRLFLEETHRMTEWEANEWDW